MEARARNRRARQRLIIILVLCALLPPVGMTLVWRSRYPRRGKLVLSVVSTLILMLMISGALRLRKPVEIKPPSVSAGYTLTETYATPAPAAAQETPAPAIGGDEVIAPANPNG